MRITTICRALAAVLLVIGLALAGGAPASAAGGKPSSPPHGKPTPPPPPPPPPIAAPADLHVTAVTQDTVSLAWSPSTDSRVISYSASTRIGDDRLLGGTVVSGIRVQEVPAPQTSMIFTSLKAGTTYTFKVRATDGTNESSSISVDATTSPDVAAPSAPTGLALANQVYDDPVDGLTASKVLLSWNSSTDDFGPIYYQVLVDGVPTANMYNTRPAGGWIGQTTTAWVRQLEPATTYTLAVRAVDRGGNVSAPSNSITITTDPSSDTVAPSTPTLTNLALGGNGGCPLELWLKWTASTDDVDQASDIEYEIRVNGTIIDVAAGWTDGVTFSEIRGANNVTIVAVDRSGNASDASNAMTRDLNWGWSMGNCL